MKAIIVAGQYASGKTETIKGLIRTPLMSGMRVGAFVAESANVAPDYKRYGLGDDARGVSFASICCPTLADMDQALKTALNNRTYDLLFLEPPGNMHPPLMAQVALEKGFELVHIINLVSQRDFQNDRHRTSFGSGVQVASIIGVTHTDGNRIQGKIFTALREVNKTAPILTFGKSELTYELVVGQSNWSLERLAQMDFDPNTMHSDHYRKMMRVVNPELSFDSVRDILKDIAESGLVERGKGTLPTYNAQVDMKGTNLHISNPNPPISPRGMGYMIFFGSEELPAEKIEQLAMAPTQQTRQIFADAPLASKIGIFARLHKASLGKTKDVLVDGVVSYAFAVDEATKIATELYYDTGDDSALRMILPVSHATRLSALAEASKVKDDPINSFTAVRIAAELINTALGFIDGPRFIDYPELSDQHQLLTIKEQVIGKLVGHLSVFNATQITQVPGYGTRLGPYIVEAMYRGVKSLEPDKFVSLMPEIQKAISNMVKVHSTAGFDGLSEVWAAMRFD